LGEQDCSAGADHTFSADLTLAPDCGGIPLASLAAAHLNAIAHKGKEIAQRRLP